MVFQGNRDSGLELSVNPPGAAPPRFTSRPGAGKGNDVQIGRGEFPDDPLGDPPGDPLPVLDLASSSPLPEDLLRADPLPPVWPAAGRTPAGSLSGRELPQDTPRPGVAASGGPSRGDPGRPVDEDGGDGATAAREPGELWLNGDVLMCACPDCRAPMSVRLWLMVADCWQCGTSIELTEQQEREARRLLEERDQRSDARQVPAAEGSAAATKAHRGATPRTPAARSPAQPVQKVAGDAGPKLPAARPAEQLSEGRRQPAPQPAGRGPRREGDARQRPSPPPRSSRRAAPDPVRRRMQQMSRRRGVQAWAHELFAMTPAWLVSLVFHLVVLTILGMLSFRDDDGPYITLSSSVDRQLHREGGQQINMVPEDIVDFDLPIPEEVDLEQQEQREAVIRADQAARELRLDPQAEDPHLPELEQVKQQIKTAGRTRQSLAARDPRLRVEMVLREGGTTLTEAAVARGLRWLAMQQHADGSWNTRSTGGAINNRAAGTSLALLPFLGAGQSHLVGRYRDHVSRGLRWLVQHQRPDGDLRGSNDNSGMYAHGQAAIVLCEAYLMSGDEELRVPAQKAIDFIVAAQHPAGGWRYRPGMPGDTSVFGWQLMALQSARVANLTVPEETFKLAGHYLDTAQSHDGARYAYMPGNRPTHVMTAEALLCRMYMGWNRQDPPLVQGMDYLADHHLPSRDQPDYYYWYYGTQAFHHLGDSQWERWNLHMRDILVNLQESRGRDAGSWPVRGPHASSGGRLYVTSLAVCTLEVYYRHLPIFRQLDLENP